jgi:hypothetical protein
MIREWMYQDGTIAQFDTQTKLIQFLSASNRENIVPPRLASNEELDSYALAYPEASQEELAERQAVTAALMSALTNMRQVTSDDIVSSVEISTALPAVRVGLEAYRDYTGRRDETMEKLVNLLLAQSVVALQILIANAGNALYNTVIQGQILKQSLETLEDRYNDHIADFHS